jgi:hypothetical protein
MHGPVRDLSDFPVVLLRKDSVLYRIHRRENSSWWCCSRWDCRFDLEQPRGTCYGAQTELACFLEVFGEFRLITKDDVDARKVVPVSLASDLKLADVTHPSALSFGLDAAVNTTLDYAGPQAWAAAFDAVGLDGIRYWVRHDPRQQSVGIAVFGETGTTPDGRWVVGDSYPIPAEVVTEGEQFGIALVSAH